MIKKMLGEICGKIVVRGILFYPRIDDVNAISKSVKPFYYFLSPFNIGIL